MSAGFVVAGVAAGLVAMRVVNEWRVRSAAREAPGFARAADGILVGAEPIWLDGDGDRGILILHGFNDTPQSVAEFAHALHARGWTVSVPLLSDHGRSAATLASHGNAVVWMACARTAWASLRTRVRRPALCGQSMGGALAAVLAVEDPPAALVLVAPYLSMGQLTRFLASLWPLWQLVVPALHSDPRKGIHDPVARSQTLGGGEFTPRLVAQILQIVTAAQRALGRVKVPTLVFNSRADYRIPVKSAEHAFAALGSALGSRQTLDKTLIWREKAGHVLTVDAGREEIFALTGDWLELKVPHDLATEPS
jgi:carboxylesterase